MSSNTCLSPYRSYNNGIHSFLVPCGKCPACINAKKKDWITRCFFESRSHPYSIFVTFTYSDINLPQVRSSDGKYYNTLNPDDMVKFLKRFRKYMLVNHNRKIRYFYSGEYGSITKRPHYHAIIFNASLHDFLTFDSANPKDVLSNKMDDIWMLGNTKVEEFKPNHAKYVVGYVSKKLGDYSDFLKPEQTNEFIRMSLKPALGSDGIKRFASSLIDSNSPFADYIPTKHLSTLYKYFLKRKYPDYKTFPNTFFYKRPDSKDYISRGSFSLIDLESLSESAVKQRIESMKNSNHSFFRFDRTMSKYLFESLHPTLSDELDSLIIDYVSTNTTYFSYNDKTLDNAIDYFTKGYDELYNLFLHTLDNERFSDSSDYISSFEHNESVKRFHKQQVMSELFDSH